MLGLKYFSVSVFHLFSLFLPSYGLLKQFLEFHFDLCIVYFVYIFVYIFSLLYILHHVYITYHSLLVPFYQSCYQFK